MADAGGVKTTLKSPQEKGLEYDQETRYKELQKRFETYRRVHSEEYKQLQDDLKLIGKRVDLSDSELFTVNITEKIDTLNAEHEELERLRPQLASILALKAASDKLDAVVLVLGGTATVDSDVAGLVNQLKMDEDAHKFEIETNTQESERLYATIADLKKQIVVVPPIQAESTLKLANSDEILKLRGRITVIRENLEMANNWSDDEIIPRIDFLQRGISAADGH